MIEFYKNFVLYLPCEKLVADSLSGSELFRDLTSGELCSRDSSGTCPYVVLFGSMMDSCCWLS